MRWAVWPIGSGGRADDLEIDNLLLGLAELAQHLVGVLGELRSTPALRARWAGSW
jgi:hypothetical protein